MNRVHANVFQCILHGRSSGQHQAPSFCCMIGGRFTRSDQAVDRGCVDNGAAPRASKCWYASLHTKPRRCQIVVDNPLPLLQRRLLQPLSTVNPRVVDQYIKPTEITFSDVYSLLPVQCSRGIKM